MAKRPCAVLCKVKSEELFLRRFWLPHYGRSFAPQDLHVHAERSADGTEDLCRQVGVSLTEIPPGAVPFGTNNVYIRGVIAELLQRYECVLFAESPDDVIVPGDKHGHDLKAYVDDFIAGPDPYRFLTCYNVTHDVDNEAPYDPSLGPLLQQRSTFIRCNQYDNSFLWKVAPTWGRGWHDLVGVNGGKRICAGGDTQGEDKRLYNLHVHYADFDLCNQRHHVRQATYDALELQNGLYSCQVDDKLRAMMRAMAANPATWFSEGAFHRVPPWMHQVI